MWGGASERGACHAEAGCGVARKDAWKELVALAAASCINAMGTYGVVMMTSASTSSWSNLEFSPSLSDVVTRVWPWSSIHLRMPSSFSVVPRSWGSCSAWIPPWCSQHLCRQTMEIGVNLHRTIREVLCPVVSQSRLAFGSHWVGGRRKLQQSGGGQRVRRGGRRQGVRAVKLSGEIPLCVMMRRVSVGWRSTKLFIYKKTRYVDLTQPRSVDSSGVESGVVVYLLQ